MERMGDVIQVAGTFVGAVFIAVMSRFLNRIARVEQLAAEAKAAADAATLAERRSSESTAPIWAAIKEIRDDVADHREAIAKTLGNYPTTEQFDRALTGTEGRLRQDISTLTAAVMRLAERRGESRHDDGRG